MKLLFRKPGNLAVLAWAASLVTGVVAQNSPHQGMSPAPSPVHTNRPAFRIPYQYDPHEIARLGAREIRLFVSEDRGQRWQHVQTVTPQAGRFDFRAAGDGEFWFTVQTVDRNGELHPGGRTLQPGLVVVVDTTRPALELELQEKEPGKVSLMWSATDPHIVPESIALEFTQTGLNDWQPLAVKTAATGQTSWSIPTGGLVAVRGRAKDLAGNEVTAQYQIQVSPAGTQNTPAQRPVFDGPVAQVPSSGGSYPPAGIPLPQIPPGPRAPLPFNDSPALNPPTQAGTFSLPGRNGLPVSGPASGSASGIPGLPASGLPTSGLPPQADPFAQRNLSTASPATDSVFGAEPASPRGWSDQLVSAIPGQGRQQTLSGFETGGAGYRTVNARKFHIDYRIDDIGPSGVSTVDLFVTQNNGEKWYRYGVDEDRHSPFEVEVPADGVYGFTLRVVSGAGLTDPPPQSGDRPELVIIVDSSPPVVQLFPLRQGQGADSSRILITWQAADQKLAERPIALSYSANPNGPWEPIADWLPNSGQYIWNIGAGVPARLYVRVVARDAAGNMARVDTPQPALVDLSKPTARIVDVESAINSGRNY